MIDLDWILNWLASLNPMVALVLHILGTLVCLMTVYVKLTPVNKVDAWFIKLESLPIVGSIIQELMNFSYVERKNNLAPPSQS